METKIANNDGNLKQYLPFKTKTFAYDVAHLLGHEPFDEIDR